MPASSSSSYHLQVSEKEKEKEKERAQVGQSSYPQAIISSKLKLATRYKRPMRGVSLSLNIPARLLLAIRSDPIHLVRAGKGSDRTTKAAAASTSELSCVY